MPTRRWCLHAASISLLGCLVADCMSLEDFHKSAQDDVKNQITQSEAKLELKSSANPQGQGIIVYSEGTGSRCRPQFAWIHLGAGHLCAVDSTARDLTPRVPVYADAPTADVERAVVKRQEIETALSKALCPDR